jgi:hypothetical protein
MNWKDNKSVPPITLNIAIVVTSLLFFLVPGLNDNDAAAILYWFAFCVGGIAFYRKAKRRGSELTTPAILYVCTCSIMIAVIATR